jgi:hypothetical protein
VSAANHDKLTPVGRYLFEAAPPPPAHLAELARPFVDRARLNYKNFRVEHEKIGSAVVKAMDDGLLTPEDATLLWLDTHGITAELLIARYCDARQYEPVIAWLRARTGFMTANWLNGYVRFALDRLVADGQAGRCASLALAHIERAMKSLRLDWKERRRNPPKKLPPETQEVMRGIQRALIARIPKRNAEMLLEIAEAEPYLAYGTDEERSSLAALREEILADQERFPAA